MRSRPVAIALLAFEAFWMLVVLPGHVRGMITMDGKQMPCCCETTAASDASDCCAAKRHGKTHEPSEQRKSQCAICDNARGFMPPPVFVFVLRPAGLLESRRLIEPTKLHLLLCRPVYFANGPPARLA